LINGGNQVAMNTLDKKAVIVGIGLILILGIGLINFSNHILTNAERELSRTQPDEFIYEDRLRDVNQTRQDSRMWNTMGYSIIFLGFFIFLILITYESDEKFQEMEKRLIYIINHLEREPKK
jgi:hypothetical protein